MMQPIDKSRQPWLMAGRIALIYLIFSILWIYVGDRLLLGFFEDSDQLTLWQTIKGGLFVVFSAILIYVLMHRALQSLHTGEANYQMMFESNPHPMFVYDLQSLAFLAVNNAAIASYGYSREEFLAMTIKEISSSEEIDRLHENIASVTNGLDRAGIWYHRTKGGRQLAVEIVSHTLTFEGRKSEVVLAHDVSKRLAAEKALLVRNIELKRRNKALEQFNYAVSHELKTPLVTIESSLGLIQETLPEEADPGMTRAFGYARTAARQMNRLLESLLLMFRIDAVDSGRDVIEFRGVVQEAVDRLTRTSSLQDINVTIAAEGPELCGDRDKLVQVWQHLTDNAVRYMGDQKHPAIDIGIEQSDQELLFYVRDNGIGIEGCYQGRVFGLFDQLDKTVGGMGLGLTLVQRIIDYYGGTIRVESAGINQGSCFYFTLPDALIKQEVAR